MELGLSGFADRGLISVSLVLHLTKNHHFTGAAATRTHTGCKTIRISKGILNGKTNRMSAWIGNTAITARLMIALVTVITVEQFTGNIMVVACVKMIAKTASVMTEARLLFITVAIVLYILIGSQLET